MQITFPLSQAPGAFLVRLDDKDIPVPHCAYEYVLELAIAHSVEGLFLQNCNSFACEGSDPNDRARHYVQKLRLKGLQIVAGYKAYRLDADFDTRSLPLPLLDNPHIDLRIRDRIRKLLT